MSNTNTTPNTPTINWKARFFALAESVQYLWGTSEWSYELGCEVPHPDAWNHLEQQRVHLSNETKLVHPLPVPVIHLEEI
jgi:hypothetical protein